MTRMIYLSVNPDEVTSYSVSLTKQSGTFSYSGILSAIPQAKQVLNIQGISGTVERITPSAGRSDHGHTIEGRMLPVFQQEYISVNFPEKSDGTPYKVLDIVTAVASKAGTSVAFAATNNPMSSYKFTGRFIDAMIALADTACGELLQQNGTWFIIPKDVAIGSFIVPINDLLSCKQSTQFDILDQLLSTISSLRDAYDQLYDLEKRKGSIEDELAKLTYEEDQEYSDFTKSVPMEPISFEYGFKGVSKPVPIPSNIKLEGGAWETFTPREGESFNPDKPNQNYYQIVPETFNGALTGNMKGCTSIQYATLLFPVNEPSNASGVYFARGKLFNICVTNGGFAGSENIPCTVGPEYRVETIYDSLGNPKNIRKLYIGFNQPADSFWGDHNDIDSDRRLYQVNLEMFYLPALINKWIFTGTVDDGAWAVSDAGKYKGYITASGMTYTLNGTSLIKLSNIGELDGVLEAANILKSSDGKVVGVITSDRAVKNLSGEIVGSLDSSSHQIVSNGKSLGFVAGSYTYQTFPGIQAEPEPSQGFGIYLMTLMTDNNDIDSSTDITEKNLRDELARIQLEMEIVAAKIECLIKELNKYGAGSLVTYIKTATDAWHHVYDEQDSQNNDLSMSNRARLNELETTAASADDALMAQLKTTQASLCDVDLSFLYNNVLPLPGNAISLSGTLTNLPVATDCGIVDSVSFNGNTVTVRARRI